MKTFALALALAGVLVGCTTAITITSEPSGATAFVDGARVGVTPCTIERFEPEGPQQFLVRVELAGYEPGQQLVQAVPVGAYTTTTLGPQPQPGQQVTFTDALASQQAFSSTSMYYGWPTRVLVPLGAPKASVPPAEAPTPTAPSPTSPSREAKRFCTACGAAAQPSAAFCGSCGSKL